MELTRKVSVVEWGVELNKIPTIVIMEINTFDFCKTVVWVRGLCDLDGIFSVG